MTCNIKPYFSIVVPLYNKEKLVYHSVRSILDQSFNDFEIIIVDDGSIDFSLNVVNKFNDPRVSIIRQSNMGPASARNSGVKVSKSDYICFLDADDRWDIDFLKRMSKLITMAPKASLYAIQYREVGDDGSIYHHNYSCPLSSKNYGYVDDFFNVYLKNHVPVSSSSVCVKKCDLIRVNGFPKGAYVGEDIYTWLKLADIGLVACCDIESASIYRNSTRNDSGRIVYDSVLPYHVKKVLGDKAQEFSELNRGEVLDFVKHSAILQCFWYICRGVKGRKIVLTMAKLLWKNNGYTYSALAIFIAILPKAFVIIMRSMYSKRSLIHDFVYFSLDSYNKRKSQHRA